MALASSTEPLRLADGRLVYPNGAVVKPEDVESPKLVEVPTNREATQLIIAARRKLSDLPDVPRTMNAVSVVLSYSLFGLDDTEIALALGMTELQVANIKMHEAYGQMKEAVVSSILNAETDDVRDLFQQYSRKAVTTIVDTMKSGTEGAKLMAAKDILDRGGFRPADVVEHRHKMEGGMVIEFIRRDESIAIPTIELEVEK